MNEIQKRYCPKIDFESYEDFKENYKVNVPETFNFGFDVVDAWAEIEPDKKALLHTDDSGKVTELTFTDMKKLSNRAANFFKAQGIKKGDKVMLVLKQRIEAWVIITALCKLGAVCIPAVYQLTPKDIIYRVNAATVKMIVSVDDSEVITHIKDSLTECPSLEKVATVGDTVTDGFIDFRNEVTKYSDVFDRPIGEEGTVVHDTMLLYFTSGTSGMPKMVLHDFSLPLGHIVTAKYWQQVRENKVHLTQTDSGWAKFAWGKIYGQWVCGACIGAYDTEKFTAAGMIDAIERLRPTTFCAPATIYNMLIKEDLSKYDFSFIEHATTAGEPFTPELFRKFEAMTGLRIHEGYGQTETSVLMANFGWSDAKTGSVGKMSPIFDFRIIDEEGKPCEDGIEGNICIAIPNGVRPVGLFREYYRDEGANERSLLFGHYCTGDKAWRDGDGYFHFVGRNDDVIKCSGYRIGPFEVESVIMELPYVYECAVTAVPDPVRVQVVKATVVLREGYEGTPELIKDIQSYVKSHTAPYKYPRVVEFVDALPKTTSGKIMRTAIRAKDMEKYGNM